MTLTTQENMLTPLHLKFKHDAMLNAVIEEEINISEGYREETDFN